MQLSIIQDEIIPIEHLPAAYLDRGLFFGDGVYEVLRSYNGKIFALDEHLHRFKNSLKAIEINGVDIEQIRTKVIKAFEKADISNARIYFHITRGSAMRSHKWSDDLTPNFFLIVTELNDTEELKLNGISVATHPDWRWKRCDIKSLNLLPNVLAVQAASRKNCFEAILVNDDGFITEGASSAFFAIFDGTLQTSPLAENILPSITRMFVVKAAENMGMNILEKQLTPKQAEQADELFIAVTTKDIVPVVKFDDKMIADGKVGKYTKLFSGEFRKFTE